MMEVAPTMTEREAPVVARHGQPSTGCSGASPQLVCSPGTYDQKHIDRIGRLKELHRLRPGILDLAHQPDEVDRR